MQPNLNEYERFIVAFSGGKDSLASLIHLLECGVPRDRIELWHHEVDGREGDRLFDWPVTPDYCRKVAQALSVPLYFSWLEGGFEREMLRDGTPKAPTHFETPEGERVVGGKGKPGTRQRFPQVSADLKVRWCSAYLKIDVARAALNNQERFKGKSLLFVSGERAQESAARSKLASFERHACDSKQKAVHAWRPLLHWDETEVWDAIARWRIDPHPAYHLGWSRLSCQFCIFGGADQFASAQQVSPERAQKLIDYERSFGTTLKRDESLEQLMARGHPYRMDPADLEAARSETFERPVFVEHWRTPAGAYKRDSAGPG